MHAILLYINKHNDTVCDVQQLHNNYRVLSDRYAPIDNTVHNARRILLKSNRQKFNSRRYYEYILLPIFPSHPHVACRMIDDDDRNVQRQ